MAKMVSVVPHVVWANKVTGAQASIFTSSPWPFGASEEVKAQWETVQKGWTHDMSNGTRGYGQPACKTKEEAEKVMELFNALDWDGLRTYKKSLS